MSSPGPCSDDLSRLSCQCRRPTSFSWSPQPALVTGDALSGFCRRKVRIGGPETMILPSFVLYVALSKSSFFQELKLEYGIF